MIEKIIFVFLGGGIGSVSRFLISIYWINKFGSGFPWQTLIVNVLGSFLLGIVMGSFTKLPDNYWYYFLAAGFCGGFTTFSTFAFENITLFKNEVTLALLYIGLSLILGFGAVVLGLNLTK